MADFPENYLRFNDQQTKNVSIAIQIEGVDLLSNRTLYTKIRYGDRGVDYGDAGIVYGGLRRIDGVRSIISLDGSSLTISQRNEPEQGRASISQISMAFVDKDQYMTQVLSPGIIIDDIMSKPVTIWLGYEDISYPEDYIVIFRGRVTDVTDSAGLVTLQFSDPNFTRRQNIAYCGKTKVTSPIGISDTTISVADNSEFFSHILGPDGTYDVGNPWLPNGTYSVLAPKKTGVRTFIKIEDEIIEYGPLGYGTNQFTGCIRGAKGTTAVAHALATDVEACVQFEDNAMDIALKTMLSGWAGYWKTNVAIFSIRQTFDPILGDQPGAIILPDHVDAKSKYGLFDGDYITISGATNPLNNGTYKIVRFADLFEEPNRIVYVNSNLYPEYPSPALLSFRSQFDTYPPGLGVKLTPADVDVEKHDDLKNSFIQSPENNLRFFLTSQTSLKSFLESQVYLVTSTYSLTRRGKLSVGITKPPLADEQLIFLDKTNVLNPDQIKPSRGLQNRKFFNEIDWDYDYDTSGKATTLYRNLDVDSISKYEVSSVLPIKAQGLRSDLTPKSTIDKKSNFFLSRYKNGSVLFDLKTNWKAGSLLEAGDTIALKDNGNLKIANFSTGERDLGVQLFEVLERSLDIKSGNSQVKLISGIGADATDRFATISPSSIVVSGTSSYLIIQDSYGPRFLGDEPRKWRDYIGERIQLHDENYTYVQETTILSLDPANNYKMYIDGLAVLPGSFVGLIIDIIDYPNNTSKTDDSMMKQIHCFFGPTVQVVSGASQTQFDVGPGDIGKFFINSLVRLHDEFYTINSPISPELKVIDINTNTITVDKPIGFVPSSSTFVTGIGMPDRAGVYRHI